MQKDITVTEFKKFLNCFENNMTVLEIRQLLGKYNMEDETINNAINHYVFTDKEKFVKRCKHRKEHSLIQKGLWIEY